MLNLQSIVIDKVVETLQLEYDHSYGNWNAECGSILAWVARLALENMANSDTLYHDIHHSVMVTMAGQQILRGKHLIEGGVTPVDYLHVLTATLCHDIGFVRGICEGDTHDEVATGIGTDRVPFDGNGTCASLSPYHVDRGKRFIHERFGGHALIDAERVASYIELTRFPPPDDDLYKDTSSYAGLVRASDLIGQLGDPDYIRKIPALFYEFEEIGANKALGCENPGGLRTNYAGFYWNVVRHYIKNGVRFLEVTQEGQQWLANLHSHVFAVEHAEDLQKPAKTSN